MSTAAARRSHVRTSLRAHFVLWAIAVAFCLPYLLPGNALLAASLGTMSPWSTRDAGEPSNDLMRDALVITLPARTLNGEMLRAGRLPLWNPLVYGGYPHLAMIQSNALYPLSAPLDVVDPVASVAWAMLLHMGIAGSLMLAFLRRSGLGAAAALLGGACFELNGMFLVRASAPSYVYTGTWLPLLLIGARALALRGPLRSGLPLAFATCLTALGGHPQIASLALCTATAYFLWTLLLGDERQGAARRGARVAAFATSVVLGLALAGFQLVPFAELVANTARVTIPLEAYLRSALPLPGIVQAVLPDAFGHPVDDGYWFGKLAHLLDGHARAERVWSFNYSGENVFTGVAPLVLAVVAVVRGARVREIAFFALAALASLAVLLGTPLLAAAYHLVPGFAHSRPDRVLFVYMAAIAVLAGHGCEAVLRPRASAPPPHGGWRLAIASAAGIVVLWAALPLVASAERLDALRRWLALAAQQAVPGMARLALQAGVATAVALAAWLLLRVRRAERIRPGAAVAAWLALVALPSLLFGWRFNPVQPRPVLGQTALERRIAIEHASGRVVRLVTGAQPILPANLLQLLGVRDAHGASAAGLARYVALVSAVDSSSVGWMKYFPSFRDPQVAERRVFDLLAGELVLTDVALPPPYELLEESGGVHLYRNPRTLPRFRLAASVERAADAAQALRRVTDPGFDPARTTVVVGAAPSAARAAQPAAGSRVTVEREEPDRVELVVDAPAGGVLATSEVLYPGWRTFVDDAPAETLLVDAAFRGVQVPPGRHRVAFVFAPASLGIGAALSAVAALALAWIAWRDE